jgi:hypothetical protein
VTSKAVLDAGGVIVEIMGEDDLASGGVATRTDLDNWVNNYSLQITTVKDPDNLPHQSLNALIRREYCFLVDLSTMKIVSVIDGTTIGGSATTSAYTGMQQMLALLGPKGG